MEAHDSINSNWKKVFKNLFMAILFLILINYSILHKDNLIFYRDHIYTTGLLLFIFLSLIGRAIYLKRKVERNFRNPNVSPRPPEQSTISNLKNELFIIYKSRLKNKLDGNLPITILIKSFFIDRLDGAKENHTQLSESETDTALIRFFDNSNGRLSIIGSAGGGKTTLLLDLAIQLLKRESNRIPILLSLETWSPLFSTFHEWLQMILLTEFNIPYKVSDQLVQFSSLILILDDLNEVEENSRDVCLAAIRKFGDYSKQIVICSRNPLNDKTVDNRIINLQVEVQPISEQQLTQALISVSFVPEYKRLSTALTIDPILKKVVETPFYLNAVQRLFLWGLSLDDLNFKYSTLRDRQKEIVERYVEESLQRKSKRQYPAVSAKRWLSFLASKLEEDKEKKIEVLAIHPGWVSSKKQNLILGGILFGCTLGVLLGATSWLICRFEGYSSGNIPLYSFLAGFAWGMISGFIIHYLSIGYFNKSDQPRKPRNLSRLFTIAYIVLITLCLAASELIKILSPDLDPKMAYEIGFGIIFAFFCSIFMFFTVPFILIYFSIYEIILINKYLIKPSFPNQRFNTMLAILNPLLHNYFSIRIILYLNDLLPNHLPIFLDEMSYRQLLVKEGGVWRFRHDILQKYFAGKWEE